MRRWLIRSTDSQRNLNVLFWFGVAGVLANRVFLVITGYPQLGNGTLHVSHAIWGGLMMVTALAVAVSSINPGVRLFAAFLGGAGFGWFVDELGKFITRNVDYFFQPTLALIYIVFLVMYLAFRGMTRSPYRSDEAVLNGLETLKSAALGHLDEEGREDALQLLEASDDRSDLSLALSDLLREAPVAPPKSSGPATRLFREVRGRLERLVQRPAFPYVFAGIVLVFASSDIAQLAQFAVSGRGINSVTLWAITLSTGVAALLALIGASQLHRKRRAAYRWFEACFLVEIFVTQIFLFHQTQLAAVLDLSITLLAWIVLGVALRVETAKVELAETVLPAAGAPADATG